jgi:hypothetical protein
MKSAEAAGSELNASYCTSERCLADTGQGALVCAGQNTLMQSVWLFVGQSCCPDIMLV